MLTEDGLIVLLDRLESAAADRARLRASFDKSRAKEREASQELARVKHDLRAAEDKIAEWAAYASQLRTAFNEITPHVSARKKILLPVLPAKPDPFVKEIPF